MDLQCWSPLSGGSTQSERLMANHKLRSRRSEDGDWRRSNPWLLQPSKLWLLRSFEVRSWRQNGMVGQPGGCMRNTPAKMGRGRPDRKNARGDALF